MLRTTSTMRLIVGLATTCAVLLAYGIGHDFVTTISGLNSSGGLAHASVPAVCVGCLAGYVYRPPTR